MDERRKFQRFFVEWNAKYTTEDNITGTCKIIDISREGTKIELFSQEKLGIGTEIKLEIHVPSKPEPIDTDVILLWIQELQEEPGFNYVVGGLFHTIKHEDRIFLIDYAYEALEQK